CGRNHKPSLRCGFVCLSHHCTSAPARTAAGMASTPFRDLKGICPPCHARHKLCGRAAGSTPSHRGSGVCMPRRSLSLLRGRLSRRRLLLSGLLAGGGIALGGAGVIGRPLLDLEEDGGHPRPAATAATATPSIAQPESEATTPVFSDVAQVDAW